MRFSIITASLNASGFLKRCIASVADQNVESEHIIQDAGSNDGTQTWLQEDRRVRAFIEPDNGMYDAINRGVRRASGNLMAWLNCDEQYLPGALARVRACFEQHPEVDVVFGNVVIVDVEGKYLCHRKVEVPWLYHTWVCHLSTLSCATFFRRDLVESRGFSFDESYRCGGDGEWMVRLLRAGIKMLSLGHFTSTFTLHGENLGRSSRARDEWERLRGTAPFWVRTFSPGWVAVHRLRRWMNGSYSQPPFEYAIYASSPEERRVCHRVPHPSFRCPY